MVFEKYFMVIPVYRISEDRYFSEMNEDFVKLITKSWDEGFRMENPSLVDSWKKNSPLILWW